MICESQTGVWRVLAQPLVRKARAESPKDRKYSLADQVGPEMSITVMWGFPEMGISENGCFIMENPFKMDSLGVPPFQETSICQYRFRGHDQKDALDSLMPARCLNLCKHGKSLLVLQVARFQRAKDEKNQ